MFAHYLQKILPGIYACETIADDTADYVLHTFTMKQLTGLGELPYVMDLYGLNKQDLNSLLARLP